MVVLVRPRFMPALLAALTLVVVAPLGSAADIPVGSGYARYYRQDFGAASCNGDPLTTCFSIPSWSTRLVVAVQDNSKVVLNVGYHAAAYYRLVDSAGDPVRLCYILCYDASGYFCDRLDFTYPQYVAAQLQVTMVTDEYDAQYYCALQPAIGGGATTGVVRWTAYTGGY